MIWVVVSMFTPIADPVPARVLPDDEVVEFDGQGHAGNKRAPDKLAVLVADFYDRIVSDSR